MYIFDEKKKDNVQNTSCRKKLQKKSNCTPVIQRTIDPQTDEWDTGQLISNVRSQMGKKYKDKYKSGIVRFYNSVKKSSYSYTNEEVMLHIRETNWNSADCDALIARYDREKQQELDRLYGGERGHMVSRHIEISDEDLVARTEGPHGIARATRFARTVKGKDKALHTLSKLQPLLRSVIKDVLEVVGDLLVQTMPQIQNLNAASVKTIFQEQYGICFDEDIEDEEGNFLITYKLLLQKGANAFTVKCDYHVKVQETFVKEVIERGHSGKTKRTWETASLYAGSLKPSFNVLNTTRREDIPGLVANSGIDRMGVTFY